MTNDPSFPPVAVLAQDLYFLSRIAASFDPLGWPWYAEPQAEPLEAHLHREPPGLLLVDLGARSVDWASVVRYVRSHPELAQVPVVGFGPHRDLELRDRALAAGCSEVIANSKLFADPSAIVRRYLSTHG